LGVWFGWTAFFHAAEAKPLSICQALFGKVTLLGQPWVAVDSFVIALPISMIVIIVSQWQCGGRQPSSLGVAE
jgi:SSS family solute:Na+ symporter